MPGFAGKKSLYKDVAKPLLQIVMLKTWADQYIAKTSQTSFPWVEDQPSDPPDLAAVRKLPNVHLVYEHTMEF